jgi:xylulokinase
MSNLMTEYIISYDLGTGGNKASLYNSQGDCLAEKFVFYNTHYPRGGWHEQKPEDWWQAVIKSTKALLEISGVDPIHIVACGISGHSLGVVPVDRSGNLLRKSVPIWSDSRPVDQAKQVFNQIDELEWYNITGNGFPAPLYSAFKIMWYRDHEPEMFEKIYKVFGTKDYINFKLTGEIITDYSYASGSGVYDLINWNYSDKLMQATGLPAEIFPSICPSTEVLGTLSDDAAQALGLPKHVKVVAGGVDNSCMALGARSYKEGRMYNSQGSSSWIAVASSKPLLDDRVRPFVFTHVVPGFFASAIPVFSSGSSFRWVRDHFCQDLIRISENENKDIYELMTALAQDVKPGANGLIFNPSLAGGSSLDASINIRGAFLGLDLGHTQSDVIRAAMEGIALEMGRALDELRKLWPLADEMVVVGGGSRSSLWRQIHADVYRLNILKTNIDQQAAALGAAALAAVGVGIWNDFDKIDEIHVIESVTKPDPENVAFYQKFFPLSKKISLFLAELGDDMKELS